jgi:hypothetical protein
MVSKILYNNSEGKEVLFKMNGSPAPILSNTSDCIDFYNTFGHITKGFANKETSSLFPEFCQGDVSKAYVNFSRIDHVELCGLWADDFLTLECYTIIRKKDNLEGPYWTTYSFSC